MEEPFLDKQNIEPFKKSMSFRRKLTSNTILSLPDFNNKLYLSKSIIFISFFSLLLGIYILYEYSYYFNPSYNFYHPSLLYYYVIIYTFNLLGIFFISFFITLIIKLVISIRQCFKLDEDEEILLEKRLNEEENFLNQILENANNISIINYTLTISIFLTILLYVLGLPFSFYLIVALICNKFYYNIINFFVIYVFMIINGFSGAIFLFVLYSFIKSNSLRKISFSFNEDYLISVYQEIDDAINLAK